MCFRIQETQLAPCNSRSQYFGGSNLRQFVITTKAGKLYSEESMGVANFLRHLNTYSRMKNRPFRSAKRFNLPTTQIWHQVETKLLLSPARQYIWALSFHQSSSYWTNCWTFQPHTSQQLGYLSNHHCKLGFHLVRRCCQTIPQPIQSIRERRRCCS